MFKDTDHTNRARAVFQALDGQHAIAGIFSPGREAQAEKLAYQEFGTATAPQRQTVGPAFDEGEQALTRALVGDIDAALEARLPPGQVGERTAGALADNLRARLESNTPPPLAESTLADRRRRGNTSTDTLVDTGDMLRAIEHDVRSSEVSDG